MRQEFRIFALVFFTQINKKLLGWMAARKFLELQMNFIKHATTGVKAMSRSEWEENKCVAADCLSQHHTQEDIYLATMSEKNDRTLH